MCDERKFDVTYTETMTYSFKVMATDEDAALDVANDVMLGTEDADGVVNVTWPEGTFHEGGWEDRAWEISESAEGDEAVPTAPRARRERRLDDEAPVYGRRLLTAGYVRNMARDARSLDEDGADAVVRLLETAAWQDRIEAAVLDEFHGTLQDRVDAVVLAAADDVVRTRDAKEAS